MRALLAVALGTAAVATAVPSEARAASADESLCADTALTRPVRLGAALAHGLDAATVRDRSDVSPVELDRLADDASSWVDPCGAVFVVDRAAPATQPASTEPVVAQLPADVFALASRPSSDRTIYLDFDGATYSGTSWDGGAEIVSPAYSADADRTTFSETELAQIHLAWQVVSEDFAPFDVNVTTAEPTASALSRTSSTDTTFGMPVVVTPTNSVGASCSCGGQAYIDVFDLVDATDLQPTWIFTNGSGVGGDDMGQVISHEVGHTLGLSHDGTSQSGYYSGASGWAPIMGSSYDRRASQWSSGEYPGATNRQDDVAIIATMVPVVADDHADGPSGATVISPGIPTSGAISSRTDTDAFSFVAGGTTTLTVSGPSAVSDLDVQVTVLDAAGAAVAQVNPTADTATDASLDATWSVDLPADEATFTAVVDGTGFGSPSQAGGYSDFGSLGAYTVSLATHGSVPATPTSEVETPAQTATAATSAAAPIAFATKRLPRALVGVRYRAAIRFSGPVREALVDLRLPRGLTWRTTDDAIRIRGTVRRATVRRFGAQILGEGISVRQRYRLVVS